jgi:hypothetical protein
MLHKKAADKTARVFAAQRAERRIAFMVASQQRFVVLPTLSLSLCAYFA